MNEKFIGLHDLCAILFFLCIYLFREKIATPISGVLSLTVDVSKVYFSVILHDFLKNVRHTP